MKAALVVPKLTPADGGAKARTDQNTADHQTPVPRSKRGFWLFDFRFSAGVIHVLDTGARIRLDLRLVGECLIWLGHHLVVRVRSWAMTLVRHDAPKIWFFPVIPRPWYLVWSAAAWAGLPIATSPEGADVAFAFEDATWATAYISPPLQSFNSGCHDVSKSRVASVFEDVFGYPLAVDPASWVGEAVDKSEINGVHDGRIVICPMTPERGRHYQRLIDTMSGGFAYDLRTHCIGGRPLAVWIKRKPPGERFAIRNLEVTLHEPENVFSAEEIRQISRFLDAMQIDWAGLDILRDNIDGRIYIVDVNKTDVGPLVALSWKDKLKSTAILARALDAMLSRARTNATVGA